MIASYSYVAQACFHALDVKILRLVYQHEARHTTCVTHVATEHNTVKVTTAIMVSVFNANIFYAFHRICTIIIEVYLRI